MTFPPYLDFDFALKIDCAKYARYRKVTFTSKYHPRLFPKLYATHTYLVSSYLQQ